MQSPKDDTPLACPTDPDVAPLVAWFHAEARRLRQENAVKSAEARQILPTNGCFTPEQQARRQKLRFDYTLPSTLVALAEEQRRVRVVGAWLLGLRQGFMHGADICDLCDEYHLGFAGAAEVDALLRPLIALKLAKPYVYDPRPSMYVGGLHDATPQNLLRTDTIFWSFIAGPRLGELPNFSL
jgi:hypothetical protein